MAYENLIEAGVVEPLDCSKLSEQQVAAALLETFSHPDAPTREYVDLLHELSEATNDMQRFAILAREIAKLKGAD